MEFSTSMSIIHRRWRFFVPAILLALAMTGGVAIAVKTTYQASTTLLLMTPSVNPAATATTRVNPWSAYGLTELSQIWAAGESSDAAKARLKDEGVTDVYTVTTDPAGVLPEIIATTSDHIPSVALSQDAILTRDLEGYMRHQQAGVPRQLQISVRELVIPLKAVKDDKSRLRVVAAVGAVTLFLALVLTVAYDSMMNRRRRRYEPAPRFLQEERYGDGTNGRANELESTAMQQLPRISPRRAGDGRSIHLPPVSDRPGS